MTLSHFISYFAAFSTLADGAASSPLERSPVHFLTAHAPMPMANVPAALPIKALDVPESDPESSFDELPLEVEVDEVGVVVALGGDVGGDDVAGGDVVCPACVQPHVVAVAAHTIVLGQQHAVENPMLASNLPQYKPEKPSYG